MSIINNHKEIDLSECGSKGFALEAIKSISENNNIKFKILSTSIEALQRHDRHNEKGVLILSGYFDFPLNNDRFHIQQNVNNCYELKTKSLLDVSCKLNIKSVHKTDATFKLKTEFDIKPITPFKIFISCRKSFKNDHEEKIKKLLSKHGLEAFFSESSSEDTTRKVIDDLSMCHAGIQIYSLKKDEIPLANNAKKNDQEYVPDAGWLLFELALMSQRTLSSKRKFLFYRLIDVTDYDKERWKKYIKYETEKTLFEFDIRNTNQFENEMEKIIIELLSELKKQKIAP